MSSHLRGYFPVTGRSTTGGVFDRLPVEELQRDHPYQWSLFVLAFASIKDTPIPFRGVVQPSLNVVTSLMDIGAIHGKPYREWPGDRRAPKDAQGDFSYLDRKDTNPLPSRFGGYCHHAAVTFPSWHRTYTMLIEQAIGEYAQNVAQQIENSHPAEVGNWVNAAKALRFPYWDWADPKVQNEGLPSLFYSETLSIMSLARANVTVPNPLSSFTLNYMPNDFTDVPRNGVTAYFTKWTKTYRHPESSHNPPGSNITELQRILKQRAESLKKSVGMLFTFRDWGHVNSAMTYDEFSNTRNQSLVENNTRPTIGSLEAPHNSMHLILGGIGHMGWPDYAGFDPIFYFHHANVDRILALWEWCYPTRWMGDGYTVQGAKRKWNLKRGTYSEVYDGVVDNQGEFGSLTPFRHPDGKYWTNEETRFLTQNTYAKYYSYKEFQGVRVDRPATNPQQRRLARARIARYYGVHPHRPSSETDWKHIPGPVLDGVDLPSGFKLIEKFRIFKVLFRLSEYALGASYHIDLYYGEEFIGSVAIFAREDNSPCAACADRRAAHSVLQGVITIPSRIIDDIVAHHGMENMDDMVRFISESFTGKLVDLNGNIVASARGGAAAVPVPPEDAAPAIIWPVEVALLSEAVAKHSEDEEEPEYFFDLKRHVDLFPSGWKAESPQAPAVAAE